jgi:hypothetical protein
VKREKTNNGRRGLKGEVMKNKLREKGNRTEKRYKDRLEKGNTGLTPCTN